MQEKKNGPMKHMTTIEGVKAALDSLRAKGVNPTGVALRDELGGGNVGVILKFKAQIEAGEVADSPHTATKSLFDDKFTNLASIIITEIDKIIKQEAQNYIFSINNYQNEANEASATIDKLSEENSSLASQLAEKDDLIRTLEARLVVQETAHARALEQSRAELVKTQTERDEANRSASYHKGLYDGLALKVDARSDQPGVVVPPEAPTVRAKAVVASNKQAKQAKPKKS
jgi:hypothetical protein